MKVVLPDEGCNIITSANSFYNYSTDLHTRQTYYIYEGVAYKQSENYSQYGYSYTGTCLKTGDLVFKPEMEFWYNLGAVALGGVIMLLVAKLIFRKWWRVLK